jgi:hypothetical protein
LVSLSTEQLASVDIRVSVVAGNGTRKAFYIWGGETAEPDVSGPAIDLFRGQIPLESGDYIITTDTRRRRSTPPVAGRVGLTHLGPWLAARVELTGGGRGDFIIDTAAGRSLVSKDLLPPDSAIRPTRMVEYSLAGRRVLTASPEGAGGRIESFLGEVEIPSLRLGGLEIKDVAAAVVEDLSAAIGQPAVGVIGMDVLVRADVVSITRSSDGPALTFKPEGTALEADLRLPFTLFGNQILVRGEVNGALAYFVLDTGAGNSFSRR